jgi:hypothetical protein
MCTDLESAVAQWLWHYATSRWSRVRDPMRLMNFSDLPSPSGRTSPGVHCNTNKYQKQKNNISVEWGAAGE